MIIGAVQFLGNRFHLGLNYFAMGGGATSLTRHLGRLTIRGKRFRQYRNSKNQPTSVYLDDTNNTKFSGSDGNKKTEG